MRRELQRLEQPRPGTTPAAEDYFAMFGLDRAYGIDTDLLRARFRELQRALHPDRFVQASAAERSASVLLASRINDAYAQLRDPLSRARYFLQLQGIDTLDGEGASLLSPDFLETQFIWREDFEAAFGARDRNAFDVLTTVLREETRCRYATLHADLKQAAYASAARVVAELQFLERLAADVVEALDRWETV